MSKTLGPDSWTRQDSIESYAKPCRGLDKTLGRGLLDLVQRGVVFYGFLGSGSRLDLVLCLGREDGQLGAGAAREGAGLVHVVLGGGEGRRLG